MTDQAAAQKLAFVKEARQLLALFNDPAWATSAQKDAPDDIDQDHVPREAQEAEKDYFSAMQQQDGQ